MPSHYNLSSASSAKAIREALTPIIHEIADRYGLDRDFFWRLLDAESVHFTPDVVFGPRVSSAGAQGVAQFMPGTAADMGLDDPFEPAAAIDASARYLSALLDQFDGDYANAIAAYNAGPEGNLQGQEPQQLVAIVMGGEGQPSQPAQEGGLSPDDAEILDSIFGYIEYVSGLVQGAVEGGEVATPEAERLRTLLGDTLTTAENVRAQIETATDEFGRAASGQSFEAVSNAALNIARTLDLIRDQSPGLLESLDPNIVFVNDVIAQLLEGGGISAAEGEAAFGRALSRTQSELNRYLADVGAGETDYQRALDAALQERKDYQDRYSNALSLADRIGGFMDRILPFAVSAPGSPKFQTPTAAAGGALEAAFTQAGLPYTPPPGIGTVRVDPGAILAAALASQGLGGQPPQFQPLPTPPPTQTFSQFLGPQAGLFPPVPSRAAFQQAFLQRAVPTPAPTPAAPRLDPLAAIFDPNAELFFPY